MDAIQEDRDGPSMDHHGSMLAMQCLGISGTSMESLAALSAQPSRPFLGFSWLGMPEKDQELQCPGAVSICFHLFP